MSFKQEILVFSESNEAWYEPLGAKFPVFFVEEAGFRRELRKKNPAVVILPKHHAQRENWTLCREIKAVTRALVAVVAESPLEPPVRMPWVDDLLDPTLQEEFIARVENLLRIAEANASFSQRKINGETNEAWKQFLGPKGLLPPFQVTGSTALDPETTGNFVRLLTSLLNTTATFIPVSPSPPWISKDRWLAPIECVGTPYCRTVAESPLRISGVTPCRYVRWLASVRAVIERRTVMLPCPGELTLHAAPVSLEFSKVLYPLGALVVGVGDIPASAELVKVGQRLKISVPLLRERAGIARALMQRKEKITARQLVDSAADYISREVSYRYNMAYQEFVQAGGPTEHVYDNDRFLPAALEKAEKLAAMGKLAAGLIHEIKNPLTSVRGFIQLLTEKATFGGKEREYLDVVLSEIDRVNEIIRSFLYLARSGEFRPVLLSLERVVKDILMVVENQAASKGIEIIYECMPDTPNVFADPEQVKQVLHNLIQNAFQAMPSGGRLVVRIAPDMSGGWVVLEVADTGVGIAPEHFSRLGEAFFTTKDDGTGLGLAISYRIIEDHHGRIEIQSEEGKGTRFLIKLPMAVDAENAASEGLAAKKVNNI
ncbi:MAG: ATP-binding protein [Bacillota bacterium]